MSPQKEPTQSIVIGRDEVWPSTVEWLNWGDVRTGLQDTFYLPDGSRANSNGQLVDALVQIVRDTGREPASLEQTKAAYGLT